MKSQAIWSQLILPAGIRQIPNASLEEVVTRNQLSRFNQHFPHLLTAQKLTNSDIAVRAHVSAQ
jgi:hypothetical protein